MDMEHQLQQLLHFSPQEPLMASPGFLAVGGGYAAHFQAGGFVEPLGAAPVGIHDGGWVEDLMQLGDELFGGDVISVVGTGDHHQPWQYDDNGGSPDGTPPSVSTDGDGSPPPGEQGAGELATEPHREDGDDASPATRKRRDRSKTIVSERKRRGRMKERLYELRSLVPNITKMDKASIIADAVVYVRNLQAHARKLKEEVAALEARPRPPAGHEQQHSGRAAAAAGRRPQQDRGHGARVTRVGAAPVGDGRFLVTVECERRDGVAAALCAAVESLACFMVESSSLVRSGPDRLVSTLTLKAREQVGAATIGAGSLKHWVRAALLKQGFRPEATVEISSQSTCRPINWCSDSF
ncbi:transcription factor FER-LIKE IRON DEFICIENCY-INDUCED TRANSCRIPTION FACTOR-like [Panicum miliaceum]|uniref:Transcription factor FER-LIKE IRON DEFICIENCY-INDUCED TRANSCRIPTION FACTOR-like n=1 Tax=Panicum miliaceum TaxID=4540 RepID=A0A3L6Q990_PANMI|nr:transcription factor FER-LIKE IRON DEFICIENCY-INDUCED TRANSCRIPTION FACTOR-like [Panicum miliaceum]